MFVVVVLVVASVALTVAALSHVQPPIKKVLPKPKLHLNINYLAAIT